MHRKVILPVMFGFMILYYVGGYECKDLLPERLQWKSSPMIMESAQVPTHIGNSKYVVVIDAGHQAKGNPEKEPVGPGAKEMKKKVSGGTRGTTTGLFEYKLNLIVAFKLQKRLEELGYQVIMTRTANDIDMSNVERAKIANEAEADAFIRIHANGSTKTSVCGMETICNTKNNPYNGDIYTECRRLSDCLITGLIEATGALSKGVWETDTMTGINWSEVPTTIVEMGYMTNPNEDELLASDDYQTRIVEGIVAGLSRYFEETED